jgi:hypothetical protein
MVARQTIYNKRYMETHPEIKEKNRIAKRNHTKKMLWHDDPEIREKYREAARERVRRWYQRQKERRHEGIVDEGSTHNDYHSMDTVS